MMRAFRSVALVLLLVLAARPPARARRSVNADEAQKLYEQVTPSLVVVKYTWESELGRRELAGAGVVVGEDGLVMSTISVFDIRIPDAQMKDFKIVIPSQEKDAEEIPATFVGRDERTNLAFLRPKDEKDGKDSNHHWKPLKFEEQAVKVGEPLLSVGLLPEGGELQDLPHGRRRLRHPARRDRRRCWCPAAAWPGSARRSSPPTARPSAWSGRSRA